MNFRDTLRQTLVAFIAGVFGFIDWEELKPERIQFWEDLISADWRMEGEGVALVRTIMLDSTRAAVDLSRTLDDELESCGYKPDALETAGTVVSVRLTTATVGRLTEADLAAAALIDLNL